MESLADKIQATGKRQSIFRARDVDGTHDPRSTLRRMLRSGQLVQVGRGLYSLPSRERSANHTLVKATQQYPGGVICLLSALDFHGIGTQIPHETWMMRQDRKAAPEDSSVRFIYGTGGGFEHGIVTHVIEGAAVCIYAPAKTVADCFKYRNKIGLDVGIEALREGWRAKHFSMDELWAAAKACRVQHIMQPFLEMLVQ